MINLNGSILPNTQALFHAGNRAFLYGDQIFETIHFYNGKLLFWEDHYFRMMGGACMLRMEIPQYLNIEFLENEIIKTINASNCLEFNSRVRLSLFRSDGGFYLPTNRSLQYLIEVDKLNEKSLCFNNKGLIIDVFHDHLKPSQTLSNLKGGNSLISVLSSIFANENNFDEAIILNSESNICETSASNIFIATDKHLITPPISSGCVNGIIRKQIIENASLWGYTIEEKNIKSFELIKADEVFLTNSIKWIQWVGLYKKRSYTNHISADLFKKLQMLILD
ncbi:MAG: aminotransferase class IV [Bacteroidetes bacterium MED-G21]|nr:MAG: aminotransferase class IV [Bacteroidetes bacterium MED-G21]|tara:strand:- start:492 stop:1331 length:840 start_codon:yes stop_codon:yes gene_type:complete